MAKRQIVSGATFHRSGSKLSTAAKRKCAERAKITKTMIAVPGCICGAVANTGMAQSLKMAVEGIYSPFSYFDNGGNLAGFTLLSNAPCVEVKLDCRVIFQEWNEPIPGLDAKKCDASVDASRIHASLSQLLAASGRRGRRWSVSSSNRQRSAGSTGEKRRWTEPDRR